MSSPTRTLTRNAQRNARRDAVRREKHRRGLHGRAERRPVPSVDSASPTNPIRYDPSRTGVLRRKAAAAVRVRYDRLRTELYRKIVLENALGLGEDAPEWFRAVHNTDDVTDDLVENDNQPRDSRGRWARVGGHVLSALTRAGAHVSHVEHAVKSYVEDRLEVGVSRLPPRLQHAVRATIHVSKLGTKAAFVTWTAGQALAERVSRERGATPEQARRLRAVVGALDLATFKPVSLALAASGVSAATLGVASFLPPASAAYLAYSTARDPLATWRAAKGLVRDTAHRVGVTVAGGTVRNSARTLTDDTATYLTQYPGDWPFAVLLAAVEGTGDLRRAVALAGRAVEGMTENVDQLRDSIGRFARAGGGRHSPVESAVKDHVDKFLLSASRAARSGDVEKVGRLADVTVKRIKTAYRNEWDHVQSSVSEKYGAQVASDPGMSEVRAALKVGYRKAVESVGEMQSSLSAGVKDKLPKGSVHRGNARDEAEAVRRHQSEAAESAYNRLALVIARHVKGPVSNAATVRESLTDNALWGILPTADKLKAFGTWLKDAAADLWRGLEETINGIADLAIRKGAGRSFDEARTGHFIDPNFRAGGREQFIDGVFRDPANRERFDALKKRNGDEVGNHRDSVVEKVERSINDAVVSDRTPTAVWKEIATIIDREKDSAVTTVNDEVVRDHAEGQIAGFEEAGVAELFPRMEWTVHPNASKSGVCPRCWAMRGTRWTIEAARGKIPMHRNCVVGESVVTSGDTLSITKAHYTGQVIEVFTASGRCFTVTENHVLLTEYGFLPARFLCEGFHVLNASDQRDVCRDPHDHRDVPCISDVFCTLSESGLVVPSHVPVPPEDFHGDGGSLDQEVHVIRPHRELRDQSRTPPREEQSLVFGKVFRSGGMLSGDSPLTLFLKRNLAASDRSVGRLRDPLAFILGRLAHAHVSGLGSGALDGARLCEALVDRTSRAPELFRQCLDAHPVLKQFTDQFRIEYDPTGWYDRLPGVLEHAGKFVTIHPHLDRDMADGITAGVQFDRVVDVRFRHVQSLPVYDLETRSTVYSVDGIITSNCKCTWAAVPADDRKKRNYAPVPSRYAPGAGAKFKR